MNLGIKSFRHNSEIQKESIIILFGNRWKIIDSD